MCFWLLLWIIWLMLRVLYLFKRKRKKRRRERSWLGNFLSLFRIRGLGVRFWNVIFFGGKVSFGCWFLLVIFFRRILGLGFFIVSWVFFLILRYCFKVEIIMNYSFCEGVVFFYFFWEERLWRVLVGVKDGERKKVVI